MKDNSGLVVLLLVLVLVVLSVFSTLNTFASFDNAPVDKEPVNSGKIGFSVIEPPKPSISHGEVGFMIKAADEES
ncbi:MAG: hypothetical protein JW716_05450 [Candidatus Aenigmarchaeota archaeon]|nr:hypothetical protein [Candidatus Aenigmarchaeota archaeon]